METLDHTLSDSSSQKFILKILEIPGKSVTQKYIDIIKNKLDSLELKYSFDIVLDENLIDDINNTNGMQSGGASTSTYPYRVFESFLDSLIRKDQSDKNWITTTSDKLEQYKNKQKSVFEKFFSYKPLGQVKEVTFDTTEQPIKAPDASPEKAPDASPEKAPDASHEKAPDASSEEVSNEVVKHTIDIPPNFMGVLYIQVTIFKPSNGLVLGLRELNQIE